MPPRPNSHRLPHEAGAATKDAAISSPRPGSHTCPQNPKAITHPISGSRFKITTLPTSPAIVCKENSIRERNRPMFSWSTASWYATFFDLHGAIVVS